MSFIWYSQQVGGTLNRMSGNKIIKSVLLIICFFTFLVGCSAADVNVQEYDSPLLMKFTSFKRECKNQKNSLLNYYSYKCNIPNERTIEISLAYVFASQLPLKSFTITGTEITAEDKEMGYAARNCYPADTMFSITKTQSTDEIAEKFGTPDAYAEYNGISVLLISNTYEYIVFYGNSTEGNMIRIDKEYKIPQNTTLQITDNAIYLFIKPNRDSNFGVSVIKISLENSEVTKQFITFEEMNLPEIKGQILVNNIFIDDGIMYFSINDFGSSSWITAYDFDSGKGNNVKIKCAYDGKLFKYQDGVGMMVSGYDNDGYNTNMGLRFFGYDAKANEFTEKEDMSVDFPKNVRYFYAIYGAEFYCTNDTLCGILIHINDGSKAYVEISLPNGEITTFIPFKTNNEYYSPFGYIIRENGVAVSPHNVS